jgi:N,N'-diacetyllegionaminate synthase
MRPIDVGGRQIGPGAPCFIAAEMGLSHNGDVSLAHRMIDAAADVGVDGVKFQTYRTDDFVSDRSLTYEYVSAAGTVVETQYELFTRCELPSSAWTDLHAHCRDRDVVFFSTPTGFDTLERLVGLDVPLLKNGSDFLLHLPLIQAMARTGRPTILSTGMATLSEIEDAVAAFRQEGGRDLVLLHCTSSYPTAPQDIHLRKIATLANHFECPTGFSDHSDGILAAIGAVAVGSCLIEKHFTLDRRLPGPDHRFSADPNQMRALVNDVRSLEQALGAAEIGPVRSELEGRQDFRLSCVAARDLGRGTVLSDRDIAFHRPGGGIPPGHLDEIIGRRVRVALPLGTVLQSDHLEPRALVALP